MKKKLASIISILSFSLVLSTEVYSSNMKTNLFGEWNCNSITKIEDGELKITDLTETDRNVIINIMKDQKEDEV